MDLTISTFLVPHAAVTSAPVRFDDDRNEAPVGRRASLVGHVDSAVLDRPGLASFGITAGHKRVTIKALVHGAYDLDHYVDAQIRATGVLTRHPGGEGDALELLVPDSKDVVIREAAVPPNQIRVSAIKDVANAAAASSFSHRVASRAGSISRGDPIGRSPTRRD